MRTIVPHFYLHVLFSISGSVGWSWLSHHLSGVLESWFVRIAECSASHQAKTELDDECPGQSFFWDTGRDTVTSDMY